MDNGIHIAITRRVRAEHLREFERALSQFASRSLSEPGTRGVHLLYPPPGSSSTEYGIMRSFASAADRDAFYQTPLYRDWLSQVERMVEGPPAVRDLHGLETWFSHGQDAPPRWKMALLTWMAVWPVSMVVPALLVPALGGMLPRPLVAGIVAAGIVVVLTWAAMPLLVRAARGFLYPKAPKGAER